MKPVFFSTQHDLHKWFEKNHKKEKELWIGYYKITSGKGSITWSQSVDMALCFGWIDGIRKSVDTERYCIRFTPRKPTSNWSAINIKKVEELIKQGKMKPEGIEAFNKKQDHKSKIYSYENKPSKLNKDYEKTFIRNKKAWAFFHSLAPSYQKTAIYWVMNAKQEATRISRLQTLIADSEEGVKIKPLRYGKK